MWSGCLARGCHGCCDGRIVASFFSCDATAHRRFIKSTVLAGKYGDSYKIELIPEVTNPFTLKYIERVCVCCQSKLCKVHAGRDICLWRVTKIQKGIEAVYRGPKMSVQRICRILPSKVWVLDPFAPRKRCVLAAVPRQELGCHP